MPNDGLQVSWGSSFNPTLQEINPSIIYKKSRLCDLMCLAEIA